MKRLVVMVVFFVLLGVIGIVVDGLRDDVQVSDGGIWPAFLCEASSDLADSELFPDPGLDRVALYRMDGMIRRMRSGGLPPTSLSTIRAHLMNDKTASKVGRPSARDKILEATLALVKEVGAPAVTIDSVAERAGLSKGGVLYHFPFKEQLLTAANEDIVRRLALARETEAARLPDTPNRALKAYVLASVFNRAGNDQLTTRMLAAGSMLKESADPIRRYWKERFPQIAAESGFDRAALAHVATEGLWFMEMLNLSPFTKEQRARLVEIILSIVDDTGLEPAKEEPLAARKKVGAAAKATVRRGRSRS